MLVNISIVSSPTKVYQLWPLSLFGVMNTRKLTIIQYTIVLAYTILCRIGDFFKKYCKMRTKLYLNNDKKCCWTKNFYAIKTLKAL